jgi:glycosyltransferase involved in cell wall biosynthesis
VPGPVFLARIDRQGIESRSGFNVKVYFFGWPGSIGGADTKLAHLLSLLRPEFDLTVVPSAPPRHLEPAGKRLLAELGIPCCSLRALPQRLSGWAVALCNNEFLTSGQACEARRRGLQIAWSNEMMCLFPAERGALILGLFDAILYVSEAQRRVLEPQYQRILSGSSHLQRFAGKPGKVEGWICAGGCHGRRVRWVMTGNYIDPAAFPYAERTRSVPGQRPLVVGRLSRPDPAKFPPDFPGFYENLGLRHARFRVMGWSSQLAAQWRQHHFDDRWDLLPPLGEPAAQFLQSLDLFVYSLHPRCRESWGRAVVEAMLSGAVALVPSGHEHHLRNLITHRQTGFLCGNPEEFGHWARCLENEPDLRAEIAQRARLAAVTRLCSADEHWQNWRRLFQGAANCPQPRRTATG